MKSRYDYYFILCMMFIMILGIYIAYDHFKQRELNAYLQVLRETVSEMISDEKARRAFEQYFADLLEHVEEDSVSPQQLEQLADNIIAIREQKDKLTEKDLRDILPAEQHKRTREKVLSALNGLFGKDEPDWSELGERFKQRYARLDSLKNERLKQQSFKKEISKQIKIHESITRKHEKIHHRAQLLFDSLRKELNSKQTGYLSEKEKEILTGQLEQLLAENDQLNRKVNALSEIQRLIDNERQKMQRKLTLMDSLKKQESAHP